jgi:hypothetical protein
MTKTVLVLVLVLKVSTIFAQNNQDPLNKPEIWAELSESPLDEQLWVRYVAKANVCMNSKEKEMINSLKNELMRRKKDPIKEGPLSVDEEKALFQDNSGRKKISEQIESLNHDKVLTNAYITDIEKFIVSEPMSLVKLKQSPIENFWIIEDAYRVEFQSLGIPFKGFREENSDVKGNKMAWIKQKERELLAAKREIFDKIRAQVSQK